MTKKIESVEDDTAVVDGDGRGSSIIDIVNIMTKHSRRYIFSFPTTLLFRIERLLGTMLEPILRIHAYILSPVVFPGCLFTIVLGSAIYYTVFIPMLKHNGYSDSYYNQWITVVVHLVIGSFFWMQVVFNFYHCFMTRNGSGPAYDRVIRQLALETAYKYPETPEEIKQCREEFENRMNERRNAMMMIRQEEEEASEQYNNSDREKKIPTWMLLDPLEWSFCTNTNQPKPPRAHYDSITNKLVLCYDHYCPFLYNSVGYFNYRYFMSLLIHAWLGSLYGLYIFHQPYWLISSDKYHEQRQFNMMGKLKDRLGDYEMKRLYYMVPFPSEARAIQLAYKCSFLQSVCFFVILLVHVYLILSGQTFLEFYASFRNNNNKYKIETQQKRRKYPYQLKGWKTNWQQVFGKQNIMLSLFLPSTREPEFFRIGRIQSHTIQEKKMSKASKQN